MKKIPSEKYPKLKESYNRLFDEEINGRELQDLLKDIK